MKDNVIKFPNKNGFDGVLPHTEEHVIQVRQDFCDDVVSDALDAIVAVFASYGIVSRGDVDSIRDVIFLEETLKAYAYRYKDIEHGLHELIDNTITISPEIIKQIEEKYTQTD